jgi:hypothetical protein
MLNQERLLGLDPVKIPGLVKNHISSKDPLTLGVMQMCIISPIMDG